MTQLDKIRNQVSNILKGKKHSKAYKVFSVSMVFAVVFTTTYSLVLPALSLEYEKASEMDGIYFEDTNDADLWTGEDDRSDLLLSDSYDYSDTLTSSDTSDTDISDTQTSDVLLSDSLFSDVQTADLPVSDLLTSEDGFFTQDVEDEISGSTSDSTAVSLSDSFSEFAVDGRILEDQAQGTVLSFDDTTDQGLFIDQEPVSASFTEDADPAGMLLSDADSFSAGYPVYDLHTQYGDVELELEFQESVSSDTSLTFQPIEDADFESYYSSAKNEISRNLFDPAAADYKVTDGRFWNITLGADAIGLTGTEISLTFDKYEETLDPTIDFRTGSILGQADRLIVISWSDGSWHIYDEKEVLVERRMDGSISQILFKTDDLMPGTADFGVLCVNDTGDQSIVDPDPVVDMDLADGVTDETMSDGFTYISDTNPDDDSLGNAFDGFDGFITGQETDRTDSAADPFIIEGFVLDEVITEDTQTSEIVTEDTQDPEIITEDTQTSETIAEDTQTSEIITEDTLTSDNATEELQIAETLTADIRTSEEQKIDEYILDEINPVILTESETEEESEQPFETEDPQYQFEAEDPGYAFKEDPVHQNREEETEPGFEEEETEAGTEEEETGLETAETLTNGSEEEEETELTAESIRETFAEAETEEETELAAESIYEASAEMETEEETEPADESVFEEKTEEETEEAADEEPEPADESVFEEKTEEETEPAEESVFEDMTEAETEEDTELAMESVFEEMTEEETEEETEAETEEETESAGESLYETEMETETEFEEIAEAETELSETYPAQTFAYEGDVSVYINAPEGAFPEHTSMKVTPVEDQKNMEDIAGAVTEENSAATICRIQAVDISFRNASGEEIEPKLPIKVRIVTDQRQKNEDTVVVHLDDAGTASTVENTSVYQSGDKTHIMFASSEGEAAAEASTEEIAEENEAEALTEDWEAAEADAAETFTEDGETLDGNDAGMLTEDWETVEDGWTEELAAKQTVEFETDQFSVYAVVYTVDFLYEVDGKTYGFTLQGADTVSLRALIEVLHVYESTEDKLDGFMNDIETVTFSNAELVVPAKVEKDTTAGQIKTELQLFPTYPLGMKQSEVLALNAKEYTAGDWILISLKAFDTRETLTVTMKTGESFDILVTDAQDAVMNGDVVQTISNPAGTTIDLFDYWIVSQNLVGRDGWGDLNQGQGADQAGDDRPLNGTGNNKGINSSTADTAHGHALKFSPAWAGTVYNGNKIGTTGNAWQSVNLDMRDGLNSYTGDQYTWNWNCPNPFTGIVQNNLYNGYPILTNNQAIGTTGESLAYLFDPGISHDGKASYSDVNQLLYVDKDGYYTYDSRDYAAAFHTGDKTFTLTEQTSSNSEIRGFWPFGTQNFWTGMHVNTQFSMPTGGQVLNPSGVLKPMQFEFSGDDDVWIYVDGILVGDAGGIHNRTEVDINFQTGKVSISGSEDKYLDDLFRTGLRDQGKTEAEIEAYIEANFDGHTFKANTYHSFDFFYLERGGGESNLYIHYNLVSTADFTAHKSYYGEDESDLLTRDQFQFELIGLDGKYRSVKNDATGKYELVQEDTTSDAIMPHASGTGDGTVASPHYEDNVSVALSSGTVNAQVYITGVSEDGNINFGTASISEMDMHDADEGNSPVYKYIIREMVPDDAVNSNGITWASATDAQKAAGGFVKDQVTYDGTVYYMTGRVTSWTETSASGQEIVRHGISKTYYTDDTYTTEKTDISFVNFENRFTPDFGNVDFEKVDGAGEPLQGAVFTLYKDEACTVPATDLDTEGHPVWSARSDADGIVSFENVRVGTYYMKETEAPDDYELDDTIYKVVIEDSKDQTKASKITILGDGSEAAVTEIANAKSGEISVVKKWLDASGKEINGGNNAATVQLLRKHMVEEEGEASGNHTVTVQMTVEDGGVKYGTPVSQTVTGDTIVIEWDDEWQRNFNWNLTVGDKTYEGWIGDEVVATENYIFEQIGIDGRTRRLTILHVQGDVSLTTKYWVPWLHSDGNHWNNLNRPVISGTGAEPNYLAEDDIDFNNEKYTQTLNSSNSWSHTWSIGGSESSHSGFDFPAMDENGKKYLYYVVELDSQGNAVEVGGSPMEGYVLRGYSANNNTGISNQGMLTVYNQTEGPNTIDVVIRKTDDAENSTNYLAGAVFKLMYRSDSTETFANVSRESVAQLDTDSQFTVPASGITLTGLVDGQYQLQEISAPAGYIITNSIPVVFTVSGGRITSTNGTIPEVRYTAASSTSDAEFIIPNTPGAALPNTGGPGTGMFTMLGCILTLGAGMLLWRRRRW